MFVTLVDFHYKIPDFVAYLIFITEYQILLRTHLVILKYTNSKTKVIFI
jgi:hypothetical protein